jgi:hypothetical protein
MCDVDCRDITWIATANDPDAIPAPLLNRFHRIEFVPRLVPEGAALDPIVLRGLAEETGLDSTAVEELLGGIALPREARRLSLRSQKRIARLALGQVIRERRLQ